MHVLDVLNPSWSGKTNNACSNEYLNQPSSTTHCEQERVYDSSNTEMKGETRATMLMLYVADLVGSRGHVKDVLRLQYQDSLQTTHNLRNTHESERPSASYQQA